MATPSFSPDTAAALRTSVEEVLLRALRTLLDRQSDTYPYIDTKLNIATGQDFPGDDPIRGRGVIYPWIQGRGIEALAAHARWVRHSDNRCTPAERDALCARIASLLPPIVESLERARAANGGQLPFMMDPAGRALSPLQPASSMSELFYTKGLIAAAHLLGEASWAALAEAIFATVLNDIRTGAFQLGQVAFDPQNPVQQIPGRFTHAGRMIALGGFPLFFEATGNPIYRDSGQEFIGHILAKHTAPPPGKADFWEYLDTAGAPWADTEGRLFSDPGHATEFVGLALAHREACGLENDAEPLLDVLEQNFANGFTGIGIVKSYDLRARQPINTDMPWWSLPETMRAAALGLRIASDTARQQRLWEILYRCHEAFCRRYLRPETGMMAVQCLHHDGSLSQAIPATPDADPCYHTGLSLIGVHGALSPCGSTPAGRRVKN